MLRLTLLALFLVVSGASAQTPPRFKFVAGQRLAYVVEQQTTVVETTIEDNQPTTSMTVNKLDLRKLWTVKTVSPENIAALELTITSMKNSIARNGPKDKDGKPTIDRTVIDSGTEEGKAATAAFLNKVILIIGMDELGRITEAKGANPTAAERLNHELPFRIVFPRNKPLPGQTWERTFEMKSPAGTGEKYDFIQTFSSKPAANGLTVFGMETTLNAEPKDPAELPPLIPVLWSGEVFWNAADSSYAGAKLAIVREIDKHQGEGSKFRFESRYTETLEK